MPKEELQQLHARYHILLRVERYNPKRQAEIKAQLESLFTDAEKNAPLIADRLLQQLCLSTETACHLSFPLSMPTDLGSKESVLRISREAKETYDEAVVFALHNGLYYQPEKVPNQPDTRPPASFEAAGLVAEDSDEEYGLQDDYDFYGGDKFEGIAGWIENHNASAQLVDEILGASLSSERRASPDQAATEVAVLNQSNSEEALLDQAPSADDSYRADEAKAGENSLSSSVREQAADESERKSIARSCLKKQKKYSDPCSNLGTKKNRGFK